MNKENMMLDTKISDILVKVFSLKPLEINISMTQKDIPKWDSLTYMDLITTIEAEYDIALKMEDILEMGSIQGIVDVLGRYQLLRQPHGK